MAQDKLLDLLNRYGAKINSMMTTINLAKGDKGDPLSVPPAGCCKVTNIYVNPQTGKLVVVYDDTPAE